MKELDAVIKVMGRPEDFGAESYDEDFEEESSEEEVKSSKGKIRPYQNRKAILSEIRKKK